MVEDYKKRLQSLLSKLFQFDVAELDFGIYRIMNQKREEIRKFIDKDLIEAVDAEFKEYSDVGKAEIEKELEEIKKKIGETIGEDAIEPSGEIKVEYRNLPIAKEYYQKKGDLDTVEVSDQQKAEIFSHIYQFFSRYYHEGDFLSLRRYSRENKYVIPYNGEEVLLHWANSDQYYIKTGEYFQNYSFKAGDYKVNFRVSNAEVDKNNVKSDKRFFVLKGDEENIVLDPEKKELTIFFEYRGLTDEEKKEYGSRNVQENIIDSVNEKILDSITDDGIKNTLERVKGDSRTSILEKHLNTYTKRNTTDYFIHKDLKGFLERELDFYIKNEVLNLDDLGSGKETGIEKYITRMKVIKAISQKIIEFLAQIEDFQKKLWEKKKFVIKTDYCMTLDKVPEEFYEEIVKNEEQINEWKELFRLEKVEKGTLEYAANGGLKIDVDYLKSHPFLVLDTKFFDQNFKDRLLATFDDLDEEIGGVMIKSENWQALNLLQEKYRETVKCIYIDPPYNTGSDEFIYKDNYQHSSWLCMIVERLMLARNITLDDSVFFISIDDHELSRLNLAIEEVFGGGSLFGPIIVQVNKGGRSYLPIAKTQEYVTCVSVNPEYLEINEIAQKAEFKYEDSRGPWMPRELRNRNPKFTRKNRPNLFFPFYVDPETCDKEGFCAVSLTKTAKHRIEVYPKNKKGEDDCWRWGKEMAEKNIDSEDPEKSNIVARKKPKGGWNIYEKYRKQTTKVKSIWDDSAVRTENGTIQLRNLFGYSAYDHPKPVDLVERCIVIGADSNEVIMDFFAGSGPVAHAVINLNREDGGKRKYILVEMGDYFDTVMKPRIQKVIYSKDWKNGKPTSKDGYSHMFKYQYLEQYEDTLNNIEFIEDGAVQKTLGDMDDYFLKYMLDFETRDSPTRLNVDKLERPFEYKLKITNNENEMREEVVDLVETFNYLLGLHVKKIRTFENNGTYYRVVFGKNGDESVAVIWRNIDGLDLKGDKDFIEETILKGTEADTIYVNGDSYLENARPIEPEFKKLMEG